MAATAGDWGASLVVDEQADTGGVGVWPPTERSDWWPPYPASEDGGDYASDISPKQRLGWCRCDGRRQKPNRFGFLALVFAERIQQPGPSKVPVATDCFRA